MQTRAPFLFCLLALTLSSCGSVSYSEYGFSPLNEEMFVQVDKQGYYRVGDYRNLVSNGRTIDTDFTAIFQSGNVRFNMPSTGKVPLLVIPLDFEDSVGKEEGIFFIQSAFSGNKASNQYVSVAEYYDYCSQGRLQLSPYVAPSFFRSSLYPRISDLSAITGSGTSGVLQSLYNEALTWFKGSYPEKDLNDFAFVAENGTKKVPLYFIYNAPYAGESDGSSNRDSMMWAFTINSPAPISWSSIDMMHVSSGKVDAHTYIHETGHLLGLEDYYDPSSTGYVSRISPLGRMDMMDCSLGDMNAFSKMLLGWERPYVPTGECEITLHQASGNNESILLSPSWNGTLFDQFVLLEFYSPTGLNRVDATLRSDPAMRLFQKAGVKAYIVRSNLKIFNGRAPTGDYLNDSNYTGQRLYMGRLNTSLSEPLIQLLDKSSSSSALAPYFVASDHAEEVRYFQNGESGSIALKEALFYEGEGIEGEAFSDLRLNGKELGCSFKVSSLSSGYAKIKITF